MGLQLNLSVSINGAYTGAAAVGSVADTIALSDALSYVTGSGAGQADLLYTEKINIAASGAQTLVLSALTDPLGAAIAFARIKAIVLFPDPGNINDIVLGDAAASAFVGPLGVTGMAHARPNGQLIFAAGDAVGWPVTASTADQLKLANSGSGTAVTGVLMLIGCAE